MIGLQPDPHYARLLEDELSVPSLYDATIRLLARSGFAIPEIVLDRDYSFAHESSIEVQQAWDCIYRDPEQHWHLYELAEKLVDVEYHLQRWRFGHLKTVERIIGFRRGTGGTAGVAYLQDVLQQRFFPELLSVRTAL